MKSTAGEPLSTANYTWSGVLEFLRSQNRRPADKDAWLIEKALMQEKINALQKELTAKTKEFELFKKKVRLIEEELHSEKTKNATEKLKTIATHQRVKSDFSPKVLPSSKKNHSPRLSFIFPGFPAKQEQSRITSPASGQSRGSIDQPTGPYFLKNQHKQNPSNEKQSPQISFVNISLVQSPLNAKGLSQVASGTHLHPVNSCRSMKSVDEKASGSLSSHRRTQSGSNLAFSNPSSLLPKPEVHEEPIGAKTSRRNLRIIEHSPDHLIPSHTDLSAISSKKKSGSNSSNAAEGTSSQTERVIPSKDKRKSVSAKHKESDDKTHSTVQNKQQIPLPLNLTPAQRHAMVETVRRKWTVDQLQPTTNNVQSTPITNNPTQNPATVTVPEKSQKILPSKRRNQSRPSPLNEIDEKALQLTKTVCTLRSHMDGVRGVFFSAKDPVLTTISEDSMVKLWDTKQLFSAPKGAHIDPYYTLRAHSGPLLAITGNQIDENISNSQENLVFTAGTEGVIRAWNVMKPETVDNFGPCGNIDICAGAWKAHEDAIWQLVHHSRENLMISSSSDGQIKLWGSSLENEGTFGLGNHIGTITYKNSEIGNYDIPTSIAWMYRKSEEIVAGYVNSTSLIVYNAENGKQVMQMKFPKISTGASQQANKVIYSEEMNFVISGHEDNRINFFDSNSGILIKSVLGHTDAITSLSINKNRNHLASVSHDGTLRIWDMRNFQCLSETMVHSKKYDEAAHCVSYYTNNQFDMLATGGADGIVKIIGYN